MDSEQRSIKIFNGSKKGFTEYVKSTLADKEYKDLTGLAYIHDAHYRTIIHKVEGQEQKDSDTPTLPTFDNLVISADEYSGVHETILFNIERYVELFKIKNLIVHNPPQLLQSNLLRAYEGELETTNEAYKDVTEPILKEIYTALNEQIIGQEEAIEKLVISIYSLVRNTKSKKPLVILLYGASGVGKTESAKIIAGKLEQGLFRKQLSMFQNNDFITYLFGGKHQEKSLARDLVERESNIILLDEFDKANQIAHSAFYQLFDEGVFEDKNYSVNLERSIILCTSNFTDKDAVRKELGDPIFSRFDAHIGYKPLDTASIKQIISNAVDKELESANTGTFDKAKIMELFEPHLSKITNARIGTNLVKEYFSTQLFRALVNPTDNEKR